MPARLALALLLALAVLLGPAQRRLETPAAQPACVAAGHGVHPRHWLGCAPDDGAPRALREDERLALGLPVDPNTASARVLAFLPGLSRRLAEEVVAERERGGPFSGPDDLLRVRGIGPRRLEQARGSLTFDAR
jgi:competence protein ComEA